MAVNSGKWIKSGLATLGAMAVALPVAGALATAEDPTQATETEAAAELTAEQVDEARQIFQDWSCGACHVHADANGTGHIGPSLDGNEAMDVDFVVQRISNGQGAMPGFGGQLTEEEIELLSVYIMQTKK